MLTFYIFIFIISCLAIFWSGKWLIEALTGIARFLEWREFVVAFFVIAIAGSIPNLFVGISSALHGIPQLSFGDIVGGNLFDLTVAVALAVLVGKGLSAQSRAVQATSVFTMVVAILPILLILDGTLGRGDGLILIFTFLFYVLWLFSKKERFTKVYSGNKAPIFKKFKFFIKDLGKVILGVTLLLVAAEGIVRSAWFFAESLNLADLGQKIDITGGIVGKLNYIKQICKCNIPVQLINGLKEGYIYKSLKNQKINCTNILIDK